MNARHIVLTCALAVSVWLTFFKEVSSDGSIAEAVVRTVDTPISMHSEIAPVSRRPSNNNENQEPVILDIQLREILFDRTIYEGERKALFGMHSWAPPPPPPPPPVVGLPTPVPSAPPLPFTYLGKKKENGQWEVYLGKGSQTFIAYEQTVIESTYRIDSIAPPTLLLTYLPLDQAQSLSIGDAD